MSLEILSNKAACHDLYGRIKSMNLINEPISLLHRRFTTKLKERRTTLSTCRKMPTPVLPL